MLRRLLFVLVIIFSTSALTIAQEFTFPITVSDGTNSQILNLKIGPNGASTFVTGDEYAPPAPPSGAFDVRIRLVDDYFSKMLPNAFTPQIFPIVYQASTGAGPIILTWDADAIAGLGTFQVTDNLTGTLYTQNLNGLNGTLNISTATGAAYITNSLRIVITPAEPEIAAAPSFSPSAGSYVGDRNVTISTTTSGATIYYTTDGSDPTTSSTVYSSAIALTAPSTTTIKALAVRTGYNDSGIVSGVFSLNLQESEAPVFSLDGGEYIGDKTITLSTSTSGASIYYTTDGSAPTTSSTVYSTPIVLTAPSETTIRAVAGGTGFATSSEVSKTYTLLLPLAVAPVISPNGGNFLNEQVVTLSTTTPGGIIYYTTDGSTPSESSLVYSESIDLVAPSETTIKAYVVVAGYRDSDVSEATFILTIRTDEEAPEIVASDPVYEDVDQDPISGAFSYSINVDEGVTEIMKFIVVNEEDPVTWSLSGGANASLFNINQNGDVSFKSPAVEGTYVVVVRATDSAENFTDVTLTVIVGDEDPIGEDEFEIPDDVSDLFKDINVDFNEDDFELQLKVETLPVGTKMFAFVAVIVSDSSKTTGSGQILNDEFANPDIIILSEDDGTSNEIILTKEKIDAALLEAGIFAGQTVTLKWTLRATGDDFVKYAPVSAELKVTRDDNAPNPVSIEDEVELPSEITLNQNYPNPFNPSTSIRFSLPASDLVTIQVYSITGQLVATLLNENRSAGWHTVNFDAANLSSGIYVYRMTTGTQSITKKMLFVK